MDRGAETAVLHDGIEALESIDRTEEGDQSDRGESAHSRDSGEQLSLFRGPERHPDRPVQGVSGLFDGRELLEPALDLGKAGIHYARPQRALLQEARTEGDSLLEKDGVDVVRHPGPQLGVVHPLADQLAKSPLFREGTWASGAASSRASFANFSESTRSVFSVVLLTNFVWNGLASRTSAPVAAVAS